MTSTWLFLFVLTYCIHSARSPAPGKTVEYQTDCKNLRMGQFICPDPAYEFIDPETQQLRGCTKDNIAQGFDCLPQNYFHFKQY